MSAEHFVIYGCLVVAVILHEVSHGVVALFYGDDTAKQAGRLTLNPIPHIDPFGSVILPGMLVLAGLPALGWAKPVPVIPSRLRDPRRQMLFVGLAGPFTNFTLMLAAAVAARSLTGGGGALDPRFVLASFALINLFLGVFNMLPIPPLDGSSLIERVLPQRALPTWWKIRPYGILVLFLGLFFVRIEGQSFFGYLIGPFSNALIDFIRT